MFESIGTFGEEGTLLHYLTLLDVLACLFPLIIAIFAIWHDHFNIKKSGFKKISLTGWGIGGCSLILFVISLIMTYKSTEEKITKHKTLIEKNETIIESLDIALGLVGELNEEITKSKKDIKSLFSAGIEDAEKSIKDGILEHEKHLTQRVTDSTDILSSLLHLGQLNTKYRDIGYFLFYSEIEDAQKNIAIKVEENRKSIAHLRNTLPEQIETAKLLVNFSSGKDSLSDDNKNKINQFIKNLSSDSSVHFQVNGYASHTGSLRDNFKYAKNRRDSVYDYLTGTLNISTDKIKTDKINDVDTWITNNQKVELIVLPDSER